MTEDTEAQFFMTGRDGEEVNVSIQNDAADKGSPWISDLYDYFAPVRDEVGAAGYSVDEVNADIEAALRAVRANRGEVRRVTGTESAGLD